MMWYSWFRHLWVSIYQETLIRESIRFLSVCRWQTVKNTSNVAVSFSISSILTFAFNYLQHFSSPTPNWQSLTSFLKTEMLCKSKNLQLCVRSKHYTQYQTEMSSLTDSKFQLLYLYLKYLQKCVRDTWSPCSCLSLHAAVTVDVLQTGVTNQRSILIVYLLIFKNVVPSLSEIRLSAVFSLLHRLNHCWWYVRHLQLAQQSTSSA